MRIRQKSMAQGLIIGMLSLGALDAHASESWIGPYIGMQVGYGEADLELEADHIPRPASGWSYPDFADLKGLTFDDTLKGGLAGIMAGYRWQKDDWVYGLEAAYSVTRIDAKDWTRADDQRAPLKPGDIVSAQDDEFDNELRSLATLSASLGRSFKGWLVYGKAGLAAGNLKTKVIDRNLDRNGVDTANNIGGGSDDQWLYGYTLATGARYRIASRWSLGVEYQYIRLTGSDIDPGGSGCYNTGTSIGSAPCSANGGELKPVKYEMEPEINLHSVLLNLNYHF
jgi:outer membrane immunogenic protein